MINFRNKQWFKKLSNEQCHEICENFMIDEKMFKHAGRAGENGEILIDLLRIDHINYIPDIWTETYDKLKTYNFNINSEDQLEFLKNIYLLFNTNVKFRKYNDSIHNEVLVEQAFNNSNYWIKKLIDETDLEYSKYCSYQIYTIIKILFENDLQLIKQK